MCIRDRLGEQHDDPVHQRRHRATIERLAAQGLLAAVVLEMSDQGASTAALPPTATEGAARTALRWNEAGWPWAPYAPAVMAAVRAGVPVLGGNLPRERLRAAMGDEALDAALGPGARQAQRDAIRTGHCDLLPPSQLDGMVRVQVARDRSLAQAITSSAVPGKTVVLLAGRGQVARDAHGPSRAVAGLAGVRRGAGHRPLRAAARADAAAADVLTRAATHACGSRPRAC